MIDLAQEENDRKERWRSLLQAKDSKPSTPQVFKDEPRKERWSALLKQPEKKQLEQKQDTWGDILSPLMESAEKLWTGQLGIKPITEYIKERTTVPESPPISKEYARGFTENLNQSVYQMWGKMPSGDEIVRSMETGEPIPPVVRKKYVSAMKPKAGLKDVAGSIGMTLVDFIAWLPIMATKFIKDPKGSLYHDPVGTLMLGHVASSMIKGKPPVRKPIELPPMEKIPVLGEEPRIRGGVPRKARKLAGLKEPALPSVIQVGNILEHEGPLGVTFRVKVLDTNPKNLPDYLSKKKDLVEVEYVGNIRTGQREFFPKSELTKEWTLTKPTEPIKPPQPGSLAETKAFVKQARSIQKRYKAGEDITKLAEESRDIPSGIMDKFAPDVSSWQKEQARLRRVGTEEPYIQETQKEMIEQNRRANRERLEKEVALETKTEAETKVETKAETKAGVEAEVETKPLTPEEQIAAYEEAGKVEKLEPGIAEGAESLTKPMGGGGLEAKGVGELAREARSKPKLSDNIKEFHSGFNLKKEFKNSLEFLKTGKVAAPVKPKEAVKPQTITPKSTELKLEPYSASTTEPLIIVKQKGGGKMPVYYHEIEPFTRGTVKDLQRRGFKYTYENPIRVFEDYPTLKESVYDAAQVANKNYAVEYTRFTKPRTSKIARWKKAIKKEGGSAERLGLWAIAEQKGGDAILRALKKNKPDKLTPAEMRVYQEGRAMFDDLFKRINQARELAGKKPMRKVDNYYTWMRNFEALEELGIDPIFSDNQVVRTHLTDTAFQFAKERKLTKEVPVRTDYFNVLDNYLRLSLRYIHRTPVLAKGRAILEPYKFNTLTKAGKATTKQWSFKESYPRLSAWMTQWLDHYSGRKQPSMTWGMQALEKTAVKLNKNIGTAILTYNARSALIQPTALRNSYIQLGERFLLEGFAENLSLAKRRFAMDKSNVLRPRMIDVHIESALEGSIQKRFYTTKKKVIQAGIKPLQWLDMEAARATWLGAYNKARKAMKLVEKEAIKYADDTVTRTQASAQPSDIAPIQRTPWGKLATLFQTFVINEWNWLSKDVMGYKNPKISMGQRAANIGRLVLSTAVANALFEGVLKIRSPFPAPEWAIIHAIESGEKDLLKLGGIAVKEMTEQIPVVGGGIRWAKPWRGMPLPAGHETVRRGLAMVPKMLDTGLAKINKEDVETLGRLLGIPGTSQVMKYLRRRKQGMSHAEAIIGVRTDVGTSKKKGGGFGY